MHLKENESFWNRWELDGNTMRWVCRTHPFYKYCRQIVESQMPRRPEMVNNVLNGPPRQTRVRRPDLCGRPSCNMMFPSEKSS